MLSTTADTPPVPQRTGLGSRRSLAVNGLVIFVGRLLSTASSLVAVPMVIAHLGLSGFGSWESIIAIAALANIFHGAISGTLLWKISTAYGTGDLKAVRYYAGVGMSLALILFLTITPIAWINRYGLITGFGVPPEFMTNAALVLPCVVGLTLLSVVSEVLGAVLSGMQRAGLTNLIQAAGTVLNYTVVVICLRFGFGFPSMAAGVFAATATSGLALYLLVSYACGRRFLLPYCPTLQSLRAASPYAAFMVLAAVATLARDHTDRVFLAWTASATWVGLFGVAARLGGLVPLACTFLYVPTSAAAGALKGRGDWTNLRRLYDHTLVLMSAGAGILVFLLGSLHDRILIAWLGYSIPEAEPILYLLLTGYACAIMLTGAGTSVCQGIGVIKMEALYLSVGLVLNILLKIVLFPIMGPTATVAASSLSWAISSVVFVIYMHREVDLPVSTTLKGLTTLAITFIGVVIVRLIIAPMDLPVGRSAALVSIIAIGVPASILYGLALVIAKVLPASEFRRAVRVWA
jgi:O-antigen/teichoic acid export membrane protein